MMATTTNNSINVKAFLHYGDGYNGLNKQYPFNKIIVTAGVKKIPEQLFNQLTIGGLMIIPLGEKEHIMSLLIKTSNNSYEKIEYNNYNKRYFKFVPMLKNIK